MKSHARKVFDKKLAKVASECRKNTSCFVTLHNDLNDLVESHSALTYLKRSRMAVWYGYRPHAGLIKGQDVAPWVETLL